jgi:ABC-type phosphate transport system permease subunit
VIVGFILFFLAGVGFGFAAPGGYKFVPFVFPVVLALGAMIRDGLQGETLLRLLLALVVTAIGIFLGMYLDERSREGGETAEAS